MHEFWQAVAHVREVQADLESGRLAVPDAVEELTVRVIEEASERAVPAGESTAEEVVGLGWGVLGMAVLNAVSGFVGLDEKQTRTVDLVLALDEALTGLEVLPGTGLEDAPGPPYTGVERVMDVRAALFGVRALRARLLVSRTSVPDGAREFAWVLGNLGVDHVEESAVDGAQFRPGRWDGEGSGAPDDVGLAPRGLHAEAAARGRCLLDRRSAVALRRMNDEIVLVRIVQMPAEQLSAVVEVLDRALRVLRHLPG